MWWFTACPYVPGAGMAGEETYVGRFDSSSASCGAVYHSSCDEWGLPDFNDKFITFYIRPQIDLRDFKNRTEISIDIEQEDGLSSERYYPTDAYWDSVTNDWPHTVKAGEVITVTLQVSSGNFERKSYPYGVLTFPESRSIFLTEVRLRNVYFARYGSGALEDLVFSASAPTQQIPSGPLTESFFQLECPFTPITNIWLEDAKPAQYIDASCPMVTALTGGAWGAGAYGVRGMSGGTIEISVTPGSAFDPDCVTEAKLLYLKYYNFAFTLATSDGSQTKEFVPPTSGVGLPVYDPEAPDELSFGENYTYSFNIADLLSVSPPYDPIPSDGSFDVLVGVTIVPAWTSYGGELTPLDNTAFTLLGVNPIPGSSSASLFWTANKGCTETP